MKNTGCDFMTPKYDGLKYYRICNNTLDNYVEMLKRLQRRKGFTSFVLIYYSVVLIILPLTTLYFPKYLNKTIVDYSSIAISICILACSLTIQNVKYSERIIQVTKIINSLKTIKREIYNLEGNELEEKKKSYYSITDNAEPRAEIDFYKNLCHNCKIYGIDKFSRKIKKKTKSDITREDDKKDNEKTETEIESVIEHLCEINVCYQMLKSFLEYAIYFIIIVLPVIVLILSIFNKGVTF